MIVDFLFNNAFELKIVLDTGATHTTININALHIIGYDFQNCIGTSLIETGNGIIETELFELKTVSSVGIIKKQFSNSGL